MKSLMNGSSAIKYMIWQAEKGENGTVHGQGYVYLAKKKRMAQLCKMLNGTQNVAKWLETAGNWVFALLL
jgi:hypothetical protein